MSYVKFSVDNSASENTKIVKHNITITNWDSTYEPDIF
jgi:hypothetical protein